MSIKNKLNRLKGHLGTEKDKQPSPVKLSKSSIDVPFKEEWEAESVYPYYFEDSYCLVREKEYSLDQMHGIYSFGQFTAAVEAWNSSGIRHPLSAAGHGPENLFFFDTETTGLGGGTGNTIFLLGQASLHGNKIKLKQHILPHPGAEIPLYKSFLESIDYSTMVTYNGKAFDWPQVKTRHTLLREHVPKLPPFGHFDLYHAARRMWKHKLERIKLAAVEKDVLGIERKDDIPGFLAPMIYFDFVERKNPEGMLGIIKHNEIDILSLISLYTHLSFQILQLDEKQTSRELYEVGRWLSALGESSQAKTAFNKISEGESLEALDARFALAYEHKKHKNWVEAAKLWRDTADKGGMNERLISCIELAKIYEHRLKDLSKAFIYARKAMDLFDEITCIRKEETNIKKEELSKRIGRLERKCKGT
ncbi:ribonuclease H-like domain-containing protein [Cytobacillus oceanisediminis]|uniref:ribonuclease H-like domain-containing protein n=1 Tax=Cytobacillus oceanisediminis TaxID=665099 RepID=UPI0023DC8209|nr:ribonuclease H-like domain-containing protein [Cytobacillus oceanisediminis]MDF2035537.1 ribonuclease H-like domain-containing protein [Cytobacillus oceanisediminis]